MSFLHKMTTHSLEFLTTECLAHNSINQKALRVSTAGQEACLRHIYVTKVDFSCYSSQSFIWIFFGSKFL